MNRVTMVNNGSGVPQFGFEYGATEERVVQNTYTSGQISSTRAFLYDREDVIAEFSNDTFATVFRRYIHGPGIDEPLAILGDDVGEYTQYLHDGLGSVTGVVDENGKLGAIDYSAFGETRSNTVKIENRYRYTSREFVETNLYYYRARHMRPDLGRFISMDPWGMVDGTNQNIYVQIEPLQNSDPFGRVIYVCSRKTNFGIGNHAYFWYNGRCCGRASTKSCQEQGPFGSPPDNCKKVPGSDGLEDKLMKCCEETADKGTWLPPVNDCHEALSDCLKENGLQKTRPPGGRLGPPCDDCPPCPSQGAPNNRGNAM